MQDPSVYKQCIVPGRHADQSIPWSSHLAVGKLEDTSAGVMTSDLEALWVVGLPFSFDNVQRESGSMVPIRNSDGLSDSLRAFIAKCYT